MSTRILLLGHRGARRYAPENTFAAFDLALEHGADGFEFDVRCTRSRELLVCHDLRFKRLSIARSTLKELQSRCFANESPPCLEGVLQRYAHAAFLNLEIKVNGIEQLIYQTLNRYRPQRGYFISSFLPKVLRQLHEIDGSLVLGTLSEARFQLRHWEKLPAAYVVPKYRLLSRTLVEEVHAAKRLIVTWTVNEAKHMQRAAEVGVDGIISDDTKLLAQTFSALRKGHLSQ